MNLLLQSLASEQWVYLVKALLHTLWLGGLAAVGLYFILRGKIDPVARYRWCVGALLAVVLSGIVAWGILQPRTSGDHPALTMTQTVVARPVGGEAPSAPMIAASVASEPTTEAPPWRWTPWLALVWLVGMGAMLTRAGSLVVEAEKLRRRSRPLENEAVLKLIEEARRKLGVVRRIQVVVTEQLTSPAVMGLLTPVLILPLSMVTTLPLEQLQLILLHELAHIRRGDYLVNLCQLLAEALLFFNPAVWWISRQIRQEREACCDAVAIALAGEPLPYARTLLQVAGTVLTAAPAFGDRRNPSGLKDRIQRLLVPGYRPALRLTWSALIASFFVGGGLLFLSALGTRVAVAAILSPQERIDRIEKKMTELEGVNGDGTNALPVKISGKVRMADGSRVPEWISLNILSSMRQSSSVSGQTVRNGLFTASVSPGTIFIGVELTNFAPAFIGPLDGLATNRLENLEIILQRGFDVPLQLVDAQDGRSLTGAKATTMYWMHNSGFESRPWKSSADGSITLTHCADLPMTLTVNVPGYEIMQKSIEHVRAGEPLRLELHRGAVLSGAVLDKSSGQPVAGAKLHLLYQSGLGDSQRFQWDDSLHVLGKTDGRGAFVVNQLQSGARYYIGVSSPGHESVILESIYAGQSNLIVRVGPQLVVRGRVIGSPESLQKIDKDRPLWRTFYEKYENNSYGDGDNVALHSESGALRFQFTNRLAGMVKLNAGSNVFERMVDAPVDDWVIDLDQEAQKIEAQKAPMRDVIFRFKHPSGVPPHGTVSVTILDNLDKNNLTAHDIDLEITNGEVRVKIPVGGQTSIEPKRIVGYWFNHWKIGDDGQMFVKVTKSTGTLVVEIPVVPAGAIYARVRNVDGTPAGNVLFGLSELKRAPGRDDSSMLDGGSDGFSDNAPRHWVSGALPLGGTYQVHAWRENSFCVSKPIKLTESNPDADVELQFTPGKTFDGVVLDADGKPLRDTELQVSFSLTGASGFDLKSVFTDQNGRFRIENLTPECGEYAVKVNLSGLMAENVKPNFSSQPQTIRLKRGRSLAGRVVQAGTGYAIPNTQVTAGDFDRDTLPILTTRTDANGRFEFNTMADGNYTFIFGDGQLLTDKKFRANGTTNLILSLKLYEWSKVKPKAL